MVRNERIVVPPQYASLLTQFASAETLIRSLYAGSEFHRATAVRAIMSASPISQALHGPRFSAGCRWLQVLYRRQQQRRLADLAVRRHHEHSPFWWEGPDGKKILMWYSRMYTQVASLFGMPPDLDLGAESLPVFLQMYDHPGYPSDAAIVYGTQPENTDFFTTSFLCR